MGTWSIQPDPTASARQFRRSSSAHALVRFPFQGDGVQLVYGQHALGCAFEVGIDGQVVDTRHAYSETHAWTLAGPYFTTSGLTDERGVLRVQVVTREAVVAHLPLLGETLTIRPSVGTATTQTWTVLLPPANHPAVIP